MQPLAGPHPARVTRTGRDAKPALQQPLNNLASYAAGRPGHHSHAILRITHASVPIPSASRLLCNIQYEGCRRSAPGCRAQVAISAIRLKTVASTISRSLRIRQPCAAGTIEIEISSDNGDDATLKACRERVVQQPAKERLRTERLTAAMLES